MDRNVQRIHVILGKTAKFVPRELCQSENTDRKSIFHKEMSKCV